MKETEGFRFDEFVFDFDTTFGKAVCLFHGYVQQGTGRHTLQPGGILAFTTSTAAV